VDEVPGSWTVGYLKKNGWGEGGGGINEKLFLNWVIFEVEALYTI
jgi:hypothetical protein